MAETATQQPFTTMLADLEAELPKIVSITRPKGKSKDYQYFKNTETDNIFKVKLAISETVNEVLGDVETSKAQFGVTISVSMLAEDEKAVKFAEVPVVETSSFTFTAVKTSEPGFNPDKEIELMIRERVAALEAQIAGRGATYKFIDRWQNSKKIDIGKAK